jgi:signal transduction histidine kinase
MVNRQSSGTSKALSTVHSLDDAVNILLVDDDPAKLLSYEAILDVLGENLIKAGSAREAFRVLLNNVIAVILIDVCMPELDGFELAAMIRDHPRFQHTAIIFISAVLLTEADRLRGYQLGAADYVPSPVIAEVLQAKVKIFTELHRKTRQLEKLNSHLERRVSERTAELQSWTERLLQSEQHLERRVEARTAEVEAVNRQLHSQIEQREVAEAAVQQLQRLDAIGQITSGVAHDFNNLLSVILANTHLLSRELLAPNAKESLELIHAAAERGGKLTSQLLSFSRKQRLKPQAVNLNREVAGMVELLSATLGGAIHLNTTLAPHLRPALIDPTQLESMILNLAINGRDAMQAGGALSIETFSAVIEEEPSRPEDPPPGDYVGLSVKDTGVGIPAKVLPRVFEPFFTTKGPGRGSGLGLAQVFGFAKQSGGGVRIQTRVGDGTSVEVYMPCADVSVADHQRKLVDAEQGPRMRRNSCVLVVDDDKGVLKSTVRMLDFLGYAALSAENGADALRLISSEIDIDIVLADVVMPGMSGVELTGAVHATRPTLPVILCTGYVDRDSLKEIGEIPILQKPYTEGDLVDKISAALNQG